MERSNKIKGDWKVHHKATNKKKKLESPKEREGEVPRIGKRAMQKWTYRGSMKWLKSNIAQRIQPTVNEKHHQTTRRRKN